MEVMKGASGSCFSHLEVWREVDRSNSFFKKANCCMSLNSQI